MNAGVKCASPPAPSACCAPDEIEPKRREELALDVETGCGACPPLKGTEQERRHARVKVLAHLERDLDLLAERRRLVLGDRVRRPVR